MADNFFQQFIPGPTHIAGNKLDLLLTNWPEIIRDVSTFHPRLGRFPSDHYAIEFTISLKFKRATAARRRVYDFKNGNFDDLRESLSRTPFNVAESQDIDEYWDNWKALFLSAVEDHVPVKTVRDTNTPPWIDSEVQHQIRKKYSALKKFCQNRTPERKRKLRSLSQDVKDLIIWVLAVVMEVGRKLSRSPVFILFFYHCLIFNDFISFKTQLLHPKSHLLSSGGPKEFEKTQNVMLIPRVRHLDFGK